MSPDESQMCPSIGRITLRYWAAARHEAGVEADVVETDVPLTLADLRDRAVALHPGSDRLPAVLGVCAALVDDRPVGRQDPGTLLVQPGATVEFLPPFAGG
ncbi:MoaD/ThiS family protein [Nocardioides sp. 616]|uniref:MoaD/ThiS family protein n=1 Tax=Nocardioides sp. 616 TaxID=2268090 RepID=UPI001F06D6B3|nr:MoaD/ThiS family protein [Nocardioides sp. 616]